ncbi:IS66 family transposase [Bacillus cereus]|uniref:Transposase n=3 Tax=Bacillus TaxID=1386 RepID=A0A2C1LY95_BACCE|nr:IS66 family transposase [Bacillus cereus]PGU02839.1 transposase [Bacillus cereus]
MDLSMKTTLSHSNQPTIESLQAQVEELTAKVRWYEEQFRLSQQKQFGTSSEKKPNNQIALELFNEAEKESDSETPEPAVETITYRRKKKRGHRAESVQNLPIETVKYRLLDEKQVCSCCGGTLHEMSVEVRKELTIVPAEVKVTEHKRYVYACRKCELDEVSTPIVTAKMPAPAFPKNIASPSIIAYIMTQKYVEGLPLYRQEKHFERMGIFLSRQTMGNWLLYGADRWLMTLYERMHEHLLTRTILHADETTFQVLREPGRAATTKSYLWLYRTGREDIPIVLYDYQPTRAGEHSKRFLTGFEGYLQVDGYSGYHQVPDVTLVGCWAHARRKFDEALKALPESQKGKKVKASEGLHFCNQLYSIERKLKHVNPTERYRQRLEKSRPILDLFSAWLHEQKDRVLPKSALGKAITYCLNQWKHLKAFLLDGHLEIDNNRSERSIKPFVIGRKNWMFSNTPRGARGSAIMYSVVETAKENNLSPYHYLRYLFETLPNINLNNKEEIDKVLPWSKDLPSSCRVPKKSEANKK